MLSSPCIRQTACRTLPRSALFSTSVPASSKAKRNHGVNDGLTTILDDHTRVPIRKPLTSSPYQNYKSFESGRVLLPNALTHDAVAYKPRLRSKKSGVAPPPSYTRVHDTFHKLSLDPRQFTTNGAVLSHFVTEMGKIKSREQTALTLKSQRLLGQTIRRAKMMGVIPTLSKSSGL